MVKVFISRWFTQWWPGDDYQVDTMMVTGLHLKNVSGTWDRVQKHPHKTLDSELSFWSPLLGERLVLFLDKPCF